MPVIPEEHFMAGASMDDFVNWDASADGALPSAFSAADASLGDTAPVFPDQAPDIDHLLASPLPQHASDRDASALMFEHPDDDDFSFWALEHYEQSNMPAAALDGTPLPAAAPAAGSGAPALALGPGSFEYFTTGLLGVPDEPCVHCSLGGYECKTIQEGSYKGYCTSCVALRCECSFGLASGGPVPTAVSFPPNPWPTLGDHPDPIHHDEDAMDFVGQLAPAAGLSSSAPCDAPALVGRASPKPFAAAQPKLGARFSRESARILKNWISTHSRHPYPTEEEKASLQRLTGLNKTQISNWLANARRRGKIPTTRSTSPHVRNTYPYAGGPGPSGPVDIPQPRRSGTPSPFHRRETLENIPLQRWANSPPENEPASVTDIARAITSSASALSSGLNSPLSLNFTDDGSGRSLFNGSSASSVGTSQSSGGGSFASAYSHVSRGSFTSAFGSLERGRRRRRRRSVPRQGAASASRDGNDDKAPDRKPTARSSKHAGAPGARLNSLVAPLKTYQCTFCTETFKTKHDWQRHEKSLHLSLERWVCAPQGAVATHPDSRLQCCAFCGHASPDEAHTESHNFASCQERSLGDRTFYRKDHLRQHLKLVHGVSFVPWSMDQWKVATPEIRSRCGFCGIAMDTWTFRVDHLADHFKTGRTMADWKGDWGFEKPVLAMVENSIPPYLIHDERNSPLPFSADLQSPSSPRNAFELLQAELSYWILHRPGGAAAATDQALRVEACRVIFAAEIAARTKDTELPASWLRDLLLADAGCSQRARLAPVRSAAESRMATMRINGKENLFDSCPLEAALQDYVRDRSHLGLTPLDSELQAAADDAIRKMDAMLIGCPGQSVHTHANAERYVTDFLCRLVKSSRAWLAEFRKRAHLPRSDAIADEARRPVDDPNSIDATIHNDSRLETELADFVRARRDAGGPPLDDASLRHQAQLIIYGFDDGWNQTAADEPAWLAAFRRKHMGKDTAQGSGASHGCPLRNGSSAGPGGDREGDPDRSQGFLVPSPFYLNDTNCYRRLAQELKRFVNVVMSPNNPNCHVPTDEEMQHQARWILFDDDDPWNQTAADNAEWLMRFKRDVGILPPDDGPGLPLENIAWNVSQGGSGFAPPYCFSSKPMAPFSSLVKGACVAAGDNASSAQLNESQTVHGGQYEAVPPAANKYLQSYTTRFAKPASVFCSRELESGLTDFVRDAVAQGQPFPEDDALRRRACEILGRTADQGTPADDSALLTRFKDMARTELAGRQGAKAQPLSVMPTTASLVTAAEGHMDFDVASMNFDLSLDSMTQEEMDNLLQDMAFEF